jgi:choline monooxygenase
MSDRESSEADVGPDALRAVQQPIAQATGLPNPAYTSAAHFRRERDSLIGPTWAGLVFTDALPDRPYALPVDFMGVPLLVLRDRAGELRVFHNVCSHRGMRLIDAARDAPAAVTCPYHAWSYDLAGRLRGTPHVGGVNQHQCPGFDRSKHGLVPVRSAVWMGMLFVNLSGDAPAFVDHIAPLQARMAQFIGVDAWPSLRPTPGDPGLSLEIRSNWKLAVENYCEAYHLPWIHPALNSYSRLEDHYCFTEARDFSGQGSLAYRLSEVAGTRLPRFEAWPAERLHEAEYPALYPNVMLGFQADHAFALIITPLAPDLSREDFRLYFAGEGAADPQFTASRLATLESWRMVFQEDVAAVEGLQRGRASPGFRGGVYAPGMDGSTHHFHRWAAAQLERASTG